ncbi:MAG: hypothetical protein CMJ49_00170 [Planctomycetaceae bacterium]|nr:hypothetical protein [Planctomycetaceae bacterium]
MVIHEQQQGAVTVIQPDGALTDTDAEVFKERVSRVMSQSLGRFVVDLSAVPYADSRGLEVLLDLTEAMADFGQTLTICAANETLREVLDLTDLAGEFEQYEDVNSGVRSFL